MSLRCKTAFGIITVVLIALSGCVNQKYRQQNCEGSVEVSFYSRTRCQNEALYPEAITDLTLCLFDSDGILAAHSYLSGVRLDADYRQTIAAGTGLYTLVAWAGLADEYFIRSPLTDGQTTRGDVMMRLRREGQMAVPTAGAGVWFGQSEAFYIDAEDDRPVTSSVNMLEVTNRITISVEGLPSAGEGVPLAYAIAIEADNGSMSVGGEITQDEVLEYTPVVISDTGILESEFTLLKLETGHVYTIVVSNTTDGSELYRGSLLGALILKNPQVDLVCDHDFTIRFTAEDQCDCGTYAITEIWVNNWLVHSYQTEL